MITIKKGLDLPISGEPDTKIEPGPEVTQVGVIADDFMGMKPTMLVKEGDRVKVGQALFSDKKQAGVLHTSPAAGEVLSINRGDKRRFLSVEIKVDGDEAETFDSFEGKLDSLSNEDARKMLVASGLWTSLRARPFSSVPPIDAKPHSIFVTAMDTNPLAADPDQIIADNSEYFIYGLTVLTKMTEGPVHLCHADGKKVAGGDVSGVEATEFSGPHPAGLVGTHIHFLDPVGPNKTVWHIGYQDVIAIGYLFVTGTLMTERVISLAGPRVKNPRVIRTRVGAWLPDLIAGELEADNNRVISGSVLAGRTMQAPTDYLGRYHNQVTVIEEGNERIFLGWQRPGVDKFSVTRAFASAVVGRGKKFDLTSSTEGSKRAMVPIGTYEKVMPLDIVATPFLRTLISRDTEQAQLMGALELDEEDLALCTVVCPGKYEYGSILRDNLTRIEKEG